MVRTKGILVNRQRPLVERLGLGVAALGFVESRQVVEKGGSGRIIRAKLFRPQSQGFLGIGFGLRVAALLE